MKILETQKITTLRFEMAITNVVLPGAEIDGQETWHPSVLHVEFEQGDAAWELLCAAFSDYHGFEMDAPAGLSAPLDEWIRVKLRELNGGWSERPK